jgi:hypothetical protein
VIEQREKNDDRNWHAEQPKQYSTAHGRFPLIGLEVPMKRATRSFVPLRQIGAQLFGRRLNRNDHAAEAFTDRPTSIKEIDMSKDAHNKAAEHHETAAKTHKMAAEHHGRGDHKKGQEESAKAQAHSKTAREHSDMAHKESQAAK